jgi:hypothetical protein
MNIKSKRILFIRELGELAGGNNHSETYGPPTTKALYEEGATTLSVGEEGCFPNPFGSPEYESA